MESVDAMATVYDKAAPAFSYNPDHKALTHVTVCKSHLEE